MKRLVFVGAGHAHLYSLGNATALAAAGAQLTLIAPGRFWYSGMGPGMLGGRYDRTEATVDVAKLIERAGGKFQSGRVARIDAHERVLELADGAHVPYDLLSLNAGSEISSEGIAGAEHAVTVKPIKNLWELRERLQARSSSEPFAATIVGSGAAGCEIAANLHHALATLGQPARIRIVSSEPQLWNQAAPKAGECLQRYFRAIGVEVIAPARATQIMESEVRLQDGRNFESELTILATGVRAPDFLRASELPCAKDGSMCVNQFLQCVAHPEVFGGGDGVWFGEEGLPRVGVYAVRQGPVLHHNLLARLRGETLRKFEPQKRFLLILNLADGTGLFARGGMVFRSRLAFRLKDWLDRRFIRKFQPT